MSGSVKPVGLFDDVPTIGAGDEPGQGDGRPAAVAERGLFDDVPNIGPDVSEGDDETPAFAPPTPPPTRLRDRLTGYLDEQPAPPTVTPPPKPDQSWMYERSDAGYTPDPAAKFTTGATKAVVEGIPSIPIEMGKAVFGSPSAEEAANPLMRAGRIARMGNAPGTEMQAAPEGTPNPAERLADIPIGMVKAVPGQIRTLAQDPDWMKKGEAFAGLGMDAALLYGGAEALRKGETELVDDAGNPADRRGPGGGPGGPDQRREIRTQRVQKPPPGPFDDIPVVTEAEAQAMLDRAGQRAREADEISPPSSERPPAPEPPSSEQEPIVTPAGAVPQDLRTAARAVAEMRETNEGLLPANGFTPDEQRQIENAGIQRQAATTEQGHAYEGYGAREMWKLRESVRDRLATKKAPEPPQEAAPAPPQPEGPGTGVSVAPAGQGEEQAAADELGKDAVDGVTAQAQAALNQIRTISEAWRRGTKPSGRKMNPTERQELLQTRGAYQHVYEKALEQLKRMDPAAHEAFLRREEPHRFEEAPEAGNEDLARGGAILIVDKHIAKVRLEREYEAERDQGKRQLLKGRLARATKELERIQAKYKADVGEEKARRYAQEEMNRRPIDAGGWGGTSPPIETKAEADARRLQEIEGRSSTRTASGDRPVRETMELLGQLADQVEKSTDRTELEQLQKDLGDLYDRAGAGEVRSQIASIRGRVTRKLKKLPAGEAPRPPTSAERTRDATKHATWSDDPRVPADQRAQSETAVVEWWDGMDPGERFAVSKKYGGFHPFVRRQRDGAIDEWRRQAPPQRAQIFQAWLRDQRPEWVAATAPLPINAAFLKTRTRLRDFLTATRAIEQAFARTRDPKKQAKLQRDIQSNAGEIEKMTDRLAALYGKDVRDRVLAELEEEVKLQVSDQPDRHEIITKKDRARQKAAKRAGRYEQMPTAELLDEYHRIGERIQTSEGGKPWTRYDDDIGETRSGYTINARDVDDKLMADGMEAELRKRGITDDDILVSYHEYLDRLEKEKERKALEEEGGAGPEPHGDDLPFTPGPPPDRAALDRFLEGSTVREPVYHGTRADFSSFSKTTDIGFHFGNSEQASKRSGVFRDWSGQLDIRGGRPRKRGPNLMPVYLSLKNPIRLPDVGSFSASNWQFLDELVRRGALTEAEADAVFNKSYGPFDAVWSKDEKTFIAPSAEKPLSYRSKAQGGSNHRVANRRLREILEAKGYDGFVYQNVHEGAGISYTVFRPEQIKSATGNRGTFDPQKASILESPAPEEITGAAIRDPKTRKVYTGTDHGDVLRKAADTDLQLWKRLDREANREEEFGSRHVGFQTNRRELISRKEAIEVARAARQLRKPQDFGEHGNSELVAGDLLEHPGPDLFGDIPIEGESQGGLFDEKAGTEASRSTPEQLRALAGERDKLAQLIKGRLKDSPSANRRLAELDRILDRDKKISGDEMAARARGEQHLDDEPPPAKDQGELLTPKRERLADEPAAVNVEGQWFYGRSHMDAIQKAVDAGGKIEAAIEAGAADDRWFVTDRGRHVEAAEAMDIAKRTRQLDPAYHEEANEFGDQTELASEWLKGHESKLDYPAAGRPYKLEDLDRATDRQLGRWLRYEERLAQRELLEHDGRGDPGTAAPGTPSKTIVELEVLEHELRAVEKKLAEVASQKLKDILTAQLHNRTRQQEAYVREWVNAGRADELPDLVRGRFRDMKPGEKEAPPSGGQERSGRENDARRRAREFWEQRMRDEARRRQQEREQRGSGRQERGDRQRQRQGPPPPRPPPPRPPPPPSMEAHPNVPPPKNAGGRVRSLWRMGRMFADAMKATVYQGRGRPRFPNHALGFFKLASEAIRVQRTDWLDVIAHEVGHHLSKLYLKHPTNKGAFKRGAIPLTPEMMKELRVMGKNLYGTRKAALGYGEEGIAEWAKFYVVDPARAAKEAPTFNAFMESTVFKDPAHGGPMLEKAFTAAREHYARYEHATPLERIKAMIDRNPRRIRLPEIRELTTHWLDDLEEFRRFDEAAKAGNARESVHNLAKLARGAPARAQSWLTEGMVDIRDGRKVGRSVIDALTEVGEKNFDDFEAYLVAKSAIERWENGINPGPRLDDARAVAAQLDGRFKKYAEVVWDHYRLLLEAKRDAGQLSQRAFKLILDKNKEHVGFYRVFEDFERPATGKGGGGRGLQGGPGVPRQHGSARDIISPLESIVTDTYRTASSISRYTALKTIVTLAEREGMGHVIDEVPAPLEVTKIYAPKVLEQLQALGLVKLDPVTGQVRPLESVDLLGEVLQAFSERERPGQAELKDLVIPIRKGETTRWFQIRDRNLYNAIEGLDPVELAGALRWYSGPVRTFRAGVTLTAKFIVKNVFRDAMTAFVRTKSTRPVAPFEHLVTGTFHWLNSPELLQRWREGGGDNATQLGLDRPTTSHNLRRLVRQNGTAGHQAFDLVQHPIDAIRMLGAIGENVTRLGEYAIVERQRLKKGLGPREAQTQASLAARDVTQDFWVAGKSGRVVNQIIAFFNAQLNSVANLGRDLRRRPEVVLPRLLVGVTIPSVALYLLQRKDPEYQRIPRWQRDLGWIYVQRGTDRSKGWDKYGTGKVEHRWFIPKPFELGVLFGSTFERLTEWAIEHNAEAAFDQFGKSVYQAVAPSIVPHIIALWHELKSNHDDFRDRPIVPRGLEGVDPRYQSRSTTGELARALGDAAPGRGISPAKIEHAVSGTTGGVGMGALGVADAGVRAFRQAVGLPPLRDRSTIFTPDPDEDPLTKVPGLSGLVRRDPKEMGEDIERVYRQYQHAEQTRQTYMHLLKEGRGKEAREYLHEHRDEIRSVATAEQTGSAPGPLRAKYEAITKLRAASRQLPERRQPIVDRMHRIIK